MTSSPPDEDGGEQSPKVQSEATGENLEAIKEAAQALAEALDEDPDSSLDEAPQPDEASQEQQASSSDTVNVDSSNSEGEKAAVDAEPAAEPAKNEEEGLAVKKVNF